MGITEELKSLEELRTKGTLTDSEFTAAKAAAIASHGKADSLKSLGTAPKPQKRSSNRVLIFVLILAALGGWSFIQNSMGGRAASRALAAAVRLPVDLKNECKRGCNFRDLRGIAGSTE